MKNIKTTQKNRAGIRQPKWLWRAALAGLTLAASVGVSRADVIVDQFNNATGAAEVAAWACTSQGWGITGTAAFSANDALSDPNSGSIQFTWNYSPADSNVRYTTTAPAPADLSGATFIEYDLMVDPASGVDNNGNIAAWQYGVNGTQCGGFNLGSWGTSFTPGVWQHIKTAITPGTFPSGPISQFFINPWNGWGSFPPGPTTMIVYMDNIVIDVPAPTYPNYVAFTFDNSTTLSSNVTSGVSGGTPGVDMTGLGWYGKSCVVTLDTTKNSTIPNASITPVPGSGAMHVVAAFDALSIDNGDVIALAFNTNFFGSGNWPDAVSSTNVMIDGTHYTAIEFDVLWDTNLSTMSITNFNSMGDIMGMPMGLLQPAAVNGGSGVNLNNTETAIPDEASNGWVHMTIAIPQSTANLNETIGLYFKKWGSGINGPLSGTAAYWLDNVVFDGGPVAIFRPTMSISEPVRGLNIVNNSGSGWDRESLLTFDTDFSWVNRSVPVTYSMNIAAFPGPQYSGYNARIYLVPNPAALEAEPDWTESSMAMISVALGTNNLANVTIGCKCGNPGANGNLYDSTNPTFNTTNSPVVGNWSFTFTHNTNILVTAPDGESTNWILPVLTGSDPTNNIVNAFGTAMEVYFGGYNNGTAHNGQRVVFANVGITRGSSTLLYDNFLEDTIIHYYLTDSGPWVQASDGSHPSEYLITADTTTKYYLDWTLPASGFSVETSSDLSSWSPASLTQAQYGDHMRSEVDVTNLPASGPFFFRLAHP